MNNYGYHPSAAPAPPFAPGPADAGPDLNPYTSIFSDPNAQLGAAVGRNALNYGRDYVSRHVSLISRACSVPLC